MVSVGSTMLIDDSMLTGYNAVLYPNEDYILLIKKTPTFPNFFRLPDLINTMKNRIYVTIIIMISTSLKKASSSKETLVKQ